MNTLRYLTFRQLAYRIRHILVGYLPGSLKSGMAVPPHAVKWAPLVAITPFLKRSHPHAIELNHKHFQFNNKAVSYGRRVDWHSPKQDRLWRYNLQYFDYINTQNDIHTAVVNELMLDWIAANPPGARDAWDPFPISLRLVNWIKYFSSQTYPPKELRAIIESMHMQAQWLEKNIEFHLLGNHLFKNAKALLFVGLFFRDRDAKRWIRKGRAILTRELEEQILDDGGHFERSLMYHCMILEDCLDLLNVYLSSKDIGAHKMAAELKQICAKMTTFLSALTHPDGGIALFNDAALGIEAEPYQLMGYYKRVTGEPALEPAARVLAFPDSGYFVLAANRKDRLIVDCGKIGPDCQTGHSHCDTLSFELSLEGRRIVVDSGCCQYEDSSIRQYIRGNVGHNTITIDRQNQSEVWGAHRCARRAKPLFAKIRKEQDGTIIFEGAHDGYRRLKGSPVHHRKIVWFNNKYLIEDRIEGRGRYGIESRLHIHPDCGVSLSSEKAIVEKDRNTLLTVCSYYKNKIQIEKGWYCPEFGKKLICSVLVIKINRAHLPTKLGWLLEL